MQTDLKKIAEWCYRQAELINSLCEIRDFPDEVKFTYGREEDLRRVHIYTGIEKISSALNLPITIIPCTIINAYERQVVCNGIIFYELTVCGEDNADDNDSTMPD